MQNIFFVDKKMFLLLFPERDCETAVKKIKQSQKNFVIAQPLKSQKLITFIRNIGNSFEKKSFIYFEVINF